MKVLTLGQPLSSNTAEVLRWLQTSMQTIQDASNEDTESVVIDGFSVTNPPDPVRTLDADGTAATPAQTPVVIPSFAWNGATDPTLAEATALIAALTNLANNQSAIVTAYATVLADNASLRAFVATYIEDSRYRGQNRED